MKVKIVNKTEFDLPKYETDGSVGMDIRANLNLGSLTLEPRKVYIVPTGLFIDLTSDDGNLYEAQIRPRSGLAAKHGITVVNSPGTIDQDYRGEIKIILMNLTDVPFDIKHGDRVAQMVINMVHKVQLEEVDMLDNTDRGEGGFGHTGVN